MNGAISCVICQDSDPNLRFFRVPNDSKRLEEWSQLLNGLEIKNSSIVCGKHFLNEHLTMNSELNCWRLNKKAIPTFHMMEGNSGDLKLINEHVFDEVTSDNSKRDFKAVATQTDDNNLSSSNATACFDCLWCEARSPMQDMFNFLKHICTQHRYEIETFLQFVDEENIDDMEKDTVEFLVDTKIERIEDDSKADEMEAYTNESCLLESDVDEIDASFELEECNVSNEAVLNTQVIDAECKTHEVIKCNTNQAEEHSVNKMLPVGEENDNQINIETSDASLVFFIIDLLQTFPQLWFVNGYQSNEYEAALDELCIQFSEKYQYLMTPVELHESLIEIRDWYQKIFKEKSFTELSFPQNEYFNKLEEFLPDKPDGKTCRLCERLFQDHVQYFAHKQLKHPKETPDSEDNTYETSLAYLKEHVSDYFCVRYPHRKGGFSYRCQICNKQCGPQCKRVFLEHIKTHLDIREYVCDICGKTFIKKVHFIIHQKRHFGLHKFKCLICDKQFTNFSLLTSHRKRYHRPLIGTFEEIEEIVKRREQIKRKVNYTFCIPYKEGNQTLFACPACKRKYKFKANCHKHFRTSHKDMIKSSEETSKVATDTNIDNLGDIAFLFDDQQNIVN